MLIQITASTLGVRCYKERPNDEGLKKDGIEIMALREMKLWKQA